MSTRENTPTKFDLLVYLAIESPDFRDRLIADPDAAAREAGISFPSAAKLVVHEDSSDEVNLVLGGQAVYLPEEALTLLALAQQDAAFKARLLKDPVTTARAEIGAVLPPSLKVNVFENSESVIHVVLPLAASPEGELSDMELEGVAGGKMSSDDAKRKLLQDAMKQQQQMMQLVSGMIKQGHDMGLRMPGLR
ncbi:MAG: NHLP leader peptide family natural product precursor [Planctomycetia bacterium]|nr:NHLP leader peptide family natural product precursor [Planctomycetia bacterium]